MAYKNTQVKSKPSDEKLCSEINEQFLLTKRYLDQVHIRMNGQEELYRAFIDPTTYPHNARVFDPRVFRVIETITPRMVAAEPEGSFYPAEEGDSETAEILNALIKYDWRRAEMFPKLTMFVKSMLIFGTAFGYLRWDYRETTKKRMKPKMVGEKMVWTPSSTETVDVCEFDGPNFEVLNIYDCFPDPNCTSLANMRWFILREFKTIKELKAENDARGEEYYKNLDELQKQMDEAAQQGGSTQSNPTDMQWREHRRLMLSTTELKGQDKSNPELVVLRRFEKDRWVSIIPAFNLVIRDVDNPYFHGELPIVYGVDYPYPGELYGMGEIEPLDRIQRAINAVLNQRLDNVQLVLRNMWKVKKNSGVDMHTLISSPGNIITTDDMTAVESLQVPDVTGPTFVQTMNYLTSALQNGSGITDYTVGLGGNDNVVNKTATGTRLIQQEANAQFKLKIQLFSHMVIERIANQWKDLRIQFTTEKQKLRIMGKDQVNNMVSNTNLQQVDQNSQPILPGELEKQSKLSVSANGTFAFLSLLPEDIQPSVVGDYDFIATVSSETLTDPDVMQQNFFTALQTVGTPEWTQGLATQKKQLDYLNLTEKVFEKLHLGLEAKNVITDVPQATEPEPAPPKVSVQIKADAATPQGQALLVEEGLQQQPNTQVQPTGTPPQAPPNHMDALQPSGPAVPPPTDILGEQPNG